jgi:hypothetical protein
MMVSFEVISVMSNLNSKKKIPTLASRVPFHRY